MQVKPSHWKCERDRWLSSPHLQRILKLESKNNQSPNETEILLSFCEVASNIASVLHMKEECTGSKKFGLSQQIGTDTTRKSAQVWRSWVFLSALGLLMPCPTLYPLTSSTCPRRFCRSKHWRARECEQLTKEGLWEKPARERGSGQGRRSPGSVWV